MAVHRHSLVHGDKDLRPSQKRNWKSAFSKSTILSKIYMQYIFMIVRSRAHAFINDLATLQNDDINIVEKSPPPQDVAEDWRHNVSCKYSRSLPTPCSFAADRC